MKKISAIFLIQFSLISFLFAKVNSWKDVCTRDTDIYQCQYLWSKLNVHTPQEAEKWIKMDMYANVKVFDVSNNKSFILANELAKYGVNNPDIAKKWKDVGAIEIGYDFASVSGHIGIGDWYKLGIKNPETASQWLQVKGINRYYADFFSQIKKWLNMGVKTPQEAKKWIAIIEKYNSYYSDDIKKDMLEIHNWIKEGFKNPRIVEQWLKLGINSPKYARKWQESGFTLKEVKQWKNINKNIDFETLKQFLQMDIKTPQEAEKWVKAVNSKRDYKNLNLHDFEKYYIVEIQNWKKLGVNSPEEAGKWEKLGVSPIDDFWPDVRDWRKVGINSPEELKKWFDLKIDDKTNRINGRLTPSSVYLLKKFHFNYSNLTKEKAEQIISDYAVLKDLKDPSELDLIYQKLKNHGCFNGKQCKAKRVINKAVIKNDKLLIGFDDDTNKLALLEFPYKKTGLFGLFKKPDIPKIFTNINNKNAIFIAIYEITGNTESVNMNDGNNYNIDVLKEIYWTVPKD